MKSFTLSEIAKAVEGQIKGDPLLCVRGIAPLSNAQADQITFLSENKSLKQSAELNATKAGAILIKKEMEGGPANRIEVENPYWAFAKVTELFADATFPFSGIHKTAMIDPNAEIGNEVGVSPFCVIGKNCKILDKTFLYPHVVIEKDVCIGSLCVIYSHVTIRKGSRIGNRVIIHPGAVIGSDGFGFAEKNGVFTKIHQLGWVEIEDDVEIGANTCIDRGALEPTLIRKGAKLDNQIHIAHNVEVGENTAIAAQTGISGSVKVGKNVKIAGQVGIAGHLEIGDNVFIGAKAGLSKSVPPNTAVTGYPARELAKAKRIDAILSSLPEFIKRIKLLEEKGKNINE
jgi:UDP-3-O-[3-hydroxymyristoyl] glucosamine N-acyltransferase